MNIRNAAGAAIAAGLLVTAVGCGGGNGQAMTSPTTPSTPSSPSNPSSGGGGTQIYNVTDVQALAKTTSESSDPVAIDDSAVLLEPANDDASDPVTVGQ
ncbi:MAG TPA: hypothetical protein VGM84_20020 [Steroidobacteraceae bacterium]|jgi:hypothetical protein